MYEIAEWSEIETQKGFFVDYAKAHGFDPLNPDHWYKQSKSDILAAEVCFFPFFLFLPVHNCLTGSLESSLLLWK